MKTDLRCDAGFMHNFAASRTILVAVRTFPVSDAGFLHNFPASMHAFRSPTTFSCHDAGF